MGASSSSLHGGPDQTRLEDLPELCISLVLSHLSPMEIATMARLNSAFRAASSADFIWLRKLTPNYAYILSRIADQGAELKSKMDIYATLCRSCPFDGGTKEVWIDKRTGGVCLAISSKAMTITGINDRRYWNRIPTDETRLQTVAYLKQIWWVEVSGSMEFQLPAETYSLLFRLHLGRPGSGCSRSRACSYSDGWGVKPAKLQFKTQDGQSSIAHFKLNNVGTWSYYHVGDFVVKDTSTETKVDFSLTQIDCTHIKRGLCVDSVLICPPAAAASLELGVTKCGVDKKII